MKGADYFEKNLHVIHQIPEERILCPDTTPVLIYLDEAEHLYRWCQQDRERLTLNGLTWSVVEDLPLRIFMLREAQKRWTNIDLSDTGLSNNRADTITRTHDFRRWLSRSLLFTFKKNPDAVTAINGADIDVRNDALIKSLMEAFSLGITYTELSDPDRTSPDCLCIKFMLSCEMASLLSTISSGMVFCSERFRTRNQAYTWLKEAVDEIRCHAQFTFRFEPWRLKGYLSEYSFRNIH